MTSTRHSWRRSQLSFGSDRGRFHAHSYYDVPVVDAAGARVAAHAMSFAGRPITPQDRIDIGVVAVDHPGDWTPVGDSTAWSWQQGPMAQWVAGGPLLVWNDREPASGGDRFVARLRDIDTGRERTLPGPVYAVTPDGESALSLNMARLDALRPGYGYAGGVGARLDAASPEDDGVWRLQLHGGEPRLILSLERAVRFMLRNVAPFRRLEHLVAGYRYWFNHAKIAPGGRRFTVKLRWRRPTGRWDDRMGVSLTCGMDGADLRLLADATSHVLWLNDDQLYFWRRDRMRLAQDAAPKGRPLADVGRGRIDFNVHMRHLPPESAATLGAVVYDTPYRETVALLLAEAPDSPPETIASFAGHVPPRGQYRCDLHPCPSTDGATIIVTSLEDGGRQIYALRRD